MTTLRFLLRETSHTIGFEEFLHFFSWKEIRRLVQSKNPCFCHNVLQSSMSRSDLRTDFFLVNARGRGNPHDSAGRAASLNKPRFLAEVCSAKELSEIRFHPPRLSMSLVEHMFLFLGESLLSGDPVSLTLDPVRVPIGGDHDQLAHKIRSLRNWRSSCLIIGQ